MTASDTKTKPEAEDTAPTAKPFSVGVQTKVRKSFGIKFDFGTSEEPSLNIVVSGPEDTVKSIEEGITAIVTETGELIDDVRDGVDVVGEAVGKIVEHGGDAASRVGLQLAGFFSKVRDVVDDANAKAAAKSKSDDTDSRY